MINQFLLASAKHTRNDKLKNSYTALWQSSVLRDRVSSRLSAEPLKHNICPEIFFLDVNIVNLTKLNNSVREIKCYHIKRISVNLFVILTLIIRVKFNSSDKTS